MIIPLRRVNFASGHKLHCLFFLSVSHCWWSFHRGQVTQRHAFSAINGFNTILSSLKEPKSVLLKCDQNVEPREKDFRFHLRSHCQVIRKRTVHFPAHCSSIGGHNSAFQLHDCIFKELRQTGKGQTWSHLPLRCY